MTGPIEPGPELDALVAEKVMSGEIAPYSRDPGHAMRALDRLTKDRMEWSFTIHLGKDSHDVYASAGDCNCPHNKDYDPEDGHGYSTEQSECEKGVESFAHAACLVALRCVKAIPRGHCILCSDACPCTADDCRKDCTACRPDCAHCAKTEGAK